MAKIPEIKTIIKEQAEVLRQKELGFDWREIKMVKNLGIKKEAQIYYLGKQRIGYQPV